MSGLDPGIHRASKIEKMDCRVKPGNDEEITALTANA
jgi:hypothetical protein